MSSCLTRMGWRQACAIGWLCAAAYSAPAVEPIEITVTKKTGERITGPVRSLPRGPGRTVDSSQFYRIELKRIMTTAPADVCVDWLLVKELPNGHLVPAAGGRTNVTLDLGHVTVVETDPALFHALEVTRRPRDGGADRIEERLHGCVVRVFDGSGNSLAEKYMPKSLEKQSSRLINEHVRIEKIEAARANPPPDPRGLELINRQRRLDRIRRERGLAP
jgi:hypothetical protein